MSAAVMEGAAGVVGTRMRRREDAALLSGEARFVHDLVVPGALHMAVVRSPYAHARITSVDVSAALGMPGVVAAFSGADLAGEWASAMPCVWPVTADMQSPPHFPLAVAEACYAGDAVAVVVAGTLAEAQDAAGAVAVGYEELPAAVDLEDAASDRFLAHGDAPTNRAYTWELVPDPEAVRRAFEDAAVTLRARYVQQRLIPSAMEPRGVCVVPHPFGGEYVVYSATQIPHILRTLLGMTAGIPEGRIRVVAPAVGGGFGSKLDVYAEELLCLALARRLRRPVRWSEERSEAAQATIHGRGQVQEIELAADADGRVRAVRVHLLADMGAYMQLVTPGVPILGAFLYHGVYDVAAYAFTCTGIFTNKTPTDAYRGAGRPEATYAIERAMDALARKLRVDPAELRRRNFIGADRFPYTSVAGLVFDSGNYEAALGAALELVDYDALREEQSKRRTEGATKLLGVGLSCYVEMCGLAPSRVLASLNYMAGGWETATVRMLPTGKVQVVTGASPQGQGHVTSWSMIVADKLGVSPEDVDVLHSDTGVSPVGLDTYGSRSLSVGGTAIALAADRLVEKARLLAAHRLEVAPEDLELSGGEFSVRGSPSSTVGLGALAFEAFSAHDLPEGMEPNLEASATFDPTNFTFPFGTHVAVVEVDTQTGRVDLVRYVAVDDCGNQINPLIVDGQVHGGIAQGVGQALYEGAVYDERGNLMTATFADYLVPAATELPGFTLGRTVTPSPSNPLGVKGIGEAGTIASTPAVVNAVVDALAHLGVEDIEMPLTPERVWRSIAAAAHEPGGDR
ncbi:MAG: xanthine dehydrogenase family protein molybdopterin-binding subunit [Actinomycetota bacterium]|nr:xanthine dehydrogenase family protein molybdopterin-binding subunit [Actinomycetota bacterium]